MKLYTSRGQVQIPSDLSFEIKKTNPFFSDEGEQSIPVSLPSGPENLRVLGHPERIAGTNNTLRKMDARLEAGILHLGGQLLVDTISKDGISAALALSESDMYAKNKDTKLPDLFKDTYHTCPSGETTPATVNGWAIYLGDIMYGRKSDIFTCAPVYVEYDKENDIAIVLNEPDYGQGAEDNENAGVRWACRSMVISSDKNEVVPDGYALTPFLYLYAFLDLLLTKLGYNVTVNHFSSSTANLNKIILLNNNADTICKGRICYGDIVPGCTVSEFTEWLEDKFHVTIMVDSAKNTASVVSMETVLSSAVTDDLTHIVDGAPSVSVSDARHVVLSSDTSSIDGAEPAEENIMDFHNKYPAVKEMNETSFRDTTTRNKYSVVLRRATGVWILNTWNPDTDSIETSVLGTNMYQYSRPEDGEAEEHDAKDVIPAMMVRRIPSDGAENTAVCAPWIGDRRHNNTGYDTSKDDKDSNQEIIVAFDAGLSGTDSYHSRSYRLATTQRYNNLGNQWNTWSLTPEDIYTLFWDGWNRTLMNNSLSVIMKADVPLPKLLNFDINAIRRYKGVKLLCTALNYTVSHDGVTCGDSEFLVLSDTGKTPTAAPLFVEQTYRWALSYPTLENEIQRLRNEHGYPADTYQATVSWSTLPAWMELYQYLRPPVGAGDIVKQFLREGTVTFATTTGSGGGGQYPINVLAQYAAELIS